MKRARALLVSMLLVLAVAPAASAQLLEIPAQLISDHVSQRRRDLRSRLLLHRLSESSEMAGARHN